MSYLTRAQLVQHVGECVHFSNAKRSKFRGVVLLRGKNPAGFYGHALTRELVDEIFGKRSRDSDLYAKPGKYIEVFGVRGRILQLEKVRDPVTPVATVLRALAAEGMIKGSRAGYTLPGWPELSLDAKALVDRIQYKWRNEPDAGNALFETIRAIVMLLFPMEKEDEPLWKKRAIVMSRCFQVLGFDAVATSAGGFGDYLREQVCVVSDDAVLPLLSGENPMLQWWPHWIGKPERRSGR